MLPSTSLSPPEHPEQASLPRLEEQTSDSLPHARGSSQKAIEHALGNNPPQFFPLLRTGSTVMIYIAQHLKKVLLVVSLSQTHTGDNLGCISCITLMMLRNEVTAFIIIMVDGKSILFKSRTKVAVSFAVLFCCMRGYLQIEKGLLLRRIA